METVFGLSLQEDIAQLSKDASTVINCHAEKNKGGVK